MGSSSRQTRSGRWGQSLVVACGVALGGLMPVHGAEPTFLYSLGDGAVFTEGCFGEPDQVPQCQCPIVFASDFEGIFGLTNVPGAGPFDTFEISNVDWTATVQETISITGSGTYEIGTGPDGNPVQRMTLDLLVNGEGPIVFDSGVVAGGDDDFPPVIDIGISDGFGCPGRRMTVAAAPATPDPADVAPPGGDGVVGILDFLAVLRDWGLSGPRPTDIDESGQVGIGDLLIVLAAWTG